ncbi:MAG: hypothetical protein K0R57_5465 [Paenibacillaceae bacterium]|jgi:hypothetical protein|nr:hypothetical protein [Paenibacillaceae bacterium]
MKKQHLSRLELFVDNVQRIKTGFIWQTALLKRLAALFYAAEDKVIERDAIRESYDFIKKNTGLFSTFRGNSALSIATLLSLTDNRETRLSETFAVYDMMKDAGMRASDFLVFAAFQVASNTDAGNYANTVIRTKTFYDEMKKKHRFLTGQDDYIFAAMLGLSDIGIEVGVARMEELYAVLKPEFSSGNSVQALTQVLVLAGKTTEAVSHLLALRDAFREQGIRIDRTDSLSSLGVLSLLPMSIEEIVNDTSETYDFLRQQKGFGSWSITKQELLILSAALVTFGGVDDVRNGIGTAALSTSITNIIIAQQTAIAASSAAAAAAASD